MQKSESETRLSRTFVGPVGAQVRLVGSARRLRECAEALELQEGEPIADDHKARRALTIEFADSGIAPSPRAVKCGEDWFDHRAAFVKLRDGWLRLERSGLGWRLSRTAASRDFAWERLLLRWTVLRRGGLPLHASVCRRGDVGLAVIGGGGSGKSGVLLSLLSQGAHWISDDEAYCEPDSDIARGIGQSIEAKRGYLRQLPQFMKLVSPRDRRRLLVDAIARRTTGALAGLPLLRALKQRLRRFAEGQATASITPSARLKETRIDAVILVGRGNESRLSSCAGTELARRASELLWAEFWPLEALDRRMACVAPTRLLPDLAEDRVRLARRVDEFLEGKQGYQLVHQADTHLDALGSILRPLWSLGAGRESPTASCLVE